MNQPMLFAPPRPPDLRDRGIDLRCCSCADPKFVADAAGARLTIADPPWRYDHQTAGSTEATDHYEDMATEDIVAVLNELACGKLALWLTWPLHQDWMDATHDARRDFRWRWGKAVAGGAWFKSDERNESHYGPGAHWASCSEPVLLYTHAGALLDRSQALRNAYHEPPGAHSRKPVEWQREWIRRWTNPGDLVVDPFAGLGSVAEACLLEGRLYLGAELSPKRHADAMGLLAQVRLAA